MVPFRILDGGDCMLVVEFGDIVDPAINERVLALDAALASAGLPGVVETVPTFRSLGVHYEPLTIDRATLVDHLHVLERAAEVTARPSRCWTIPACFDAPHGEDLAEVAGRLDLAPERLVETLLATEFRVHMYGFAPGFAYLGGLPETLATPRRAAPRPPHPPEAVMIGGGLAALAASPMPTGWWVIGRSAERLFALGRRPEFLVAAGDTLRFAAVSADAFAALAARVASGEIVARREDRA